MFIGAHPYTSRTYTPALTNKLSDGVYPLVTLQYSITQSTSSSGRYWRSSFWLLDER